MKIKSLLLTILLIACALQSNAQENEKDYVPNLTQLIEQTQKSSEDPDKMSLIWWIPKEFWRSALSEDPTFTEEGIQEFEDMFKDYTILLVVEGTIGRFGNIMYSEEEEIRKDIEIYDDNFGVFSPMDEADVPSDLLGMFGIWQPMFGSMLGAMGENINYFVFQNNYYTEVMDAYSEGKYKVKMMGEDYTYRLPLGVLFPPKTCSKCGEEFMGSYKYCPYDGKNL